MTKKASSSSIYTKLKASVIPAVIPTLFSHALALSTNAQAGQLNIQEWDDPSGAHVLFVPIMHIPMVQAQVILPVGSTGDGTQYGATNLAARLVGTSLKSQSRVAFAEAIETTGAEYDVRSGLTTTKLSFRSLSDEHVLSSVETLMARALSETSPTKDDFIQLRDSIKHDLENDKSDASTLAFRKAFKLLYAGHPYSKPVAGTLQSLSKITLRDIKKIYAKRYTAKGAVVVIVGALTRKRAATLAHNLTKQLPNNKPTPIPPIPPLPKKSTAFTTVKLKTEQTHLLYAIRAPNQTSDDFYKLLIANHVFGGNGFSSRLMQSIRSQEGLAYSAASWLNPLINSGVFFINVQTKNESSKRVQELIEQELKNMSTISNKDYKDALDNLIKKEAFLTNSNRKIADLTATIALYNLPRDYLATRSKRLKQITKKQAINAFTTLTDHPNWVRVAVGQAK